ncbi:PMS1 protein-like 1 [Pseudocercospora fuligena]|uniref:PMS1 protein-like 1 n=1 Tax=Pseudocercospora fuligena TaxID=685502 RepID=A0A8H6VK98_9PEZI|nr:PMS1 protein-like 1 [Pseudocercospora fuligena]
MGISALPQATVRTLGASQVLTDPAALVKELVDNALDANATSISIEISNNTIDVIQVRDNGHGVAPEDRPLVARRYCTSKISHDDDLKDIGGSSLGFRGEALASAAELSGTLTISTRVEGEPVAAALKIDQKGEVTGQEKASLPVGTTCLLTDFVKNHPVRRQVVLRNAETCLKKIKRTLQAYAFARSHVRLSLRVLKAKDNKAGWIYAPKANGNAEDVAFKVVGAACTQQCTWFVLEDSGFTFQTFLPRCDADASKIANHGAFISVDHRPVNASRGTFKQICKVFREDLKKSNPALADVKDPFLYLELSCPPGSYDANLEPSKDDLLFEDSTIIVEAARKLFSTVYGKDVTQNEHSEQDVGKPDAMPLDTTNSSEPMALDTSRDQPRVLEEPEDEMVPVRPESQPTGEEDVSLASHRKTRSNMYGCDEDDLDLLDQRPSTGRTEADFEELRQARKDVNSSNPWVMAKLNASVGRHLPTPKTNHISNTYHDETLPNFPSSPIKHGQNILDDETLPTPRPSSPSPAAETFHPSDHVPTMRLARDGRIVEASALPPPQPYIPSHSMILEPGDFFSDPPRQQGPQHGYGPASQTVPAAGTPLDAIPDVSTRPRRSPRKHPPQGGSMKPFVSPFIDQSPREKVWFEFPQSTGRSRAPARNRQQQNSDGLIVQGELGDLDQLPRPMTPPRQNRDIRDFVGRSNENSIADMIERRNYGRTMNERPSSTQQNEDTDQENIGTPKAAEPRPEQRGFIPASELADFGERLGAFEQPEKRTTKRRKTSERQPLRELSTNAPAAEDTERDTIDLTEHEYRPQTSRRSISRRKSSNKLARTKSSRLPLERIPAGQGTHNLVMSMKTDSAEISTMADKIDDISFLGFNEPALPAPKDLDAASSHVLTLTANLHRLLVTAGGNVDVTGPGELLKELKAAFASRKEEHEEEDIMSFS